MRTVVLVIVLTIVVVACSKKEQLSYPPLADYYPLAVGKTFTYRMDSTVRLPFGTNLVTKYFLAKDSVESQFNDAQGRPTFRIYRFLRDTLQAQPWRYVATNLVTVDHDKKWIEQVENNLRFIVLHQPLREGFQWKGNSFIDTRTGGSPTQFMDGWNYTYEDMNQPFTVRKGTFDSTITVMQIDEVSPPGPFNPAFYQQTNFSKEVYARGVGLIYKEFLHKTWSPGSWADDSYGIKLSLVDYK